MQKEAEVNDTSCVICGENDRNHRKCTSCTIRLHELEEVQAVSSKFHHMISTYDRNRCDACVEEQLDEKV